MQMRCRECAAEVAVTARVCPRCGAPIVGQPPVVADAVVTDTAVGAVSDTAVSDAAGKAVPAGVAGQPPVPYVPGSGARVPAELRLVLGEYAGIACGWFAGALACATALVIFFFNTDDLDRYSAMLDRYNGLYSLLWWLFLLAQFAFLGGAFAGAGAGAKKGVHALRARSRFSRLLRRPNNPRAATVTASNRGGRTLVLDIIPRDGTGRGYQSLSEVHLALRLKAGMLVPGETVNVYGGSGGKRELLISSPRRGRAFLGTLESQSAPQPRLLDEKVSGATLVDWAAWAASTTFSSTGLRYGYDKREVDAFRSAVRDTFLGGAVFWVSTPPVRSDDLRGKQFSTHLPGHDKKQVDAFLEAAGLSLAAMESTDRPAGPLVSGDILVRWAEWADSTTFSKPNWTKSGYEPIQVDAFQEAIRDTFLGVRKPPARSDDVRGKQFSSTSGWDDSPYDRYDKNQVAAFLDAAGIRLAAMESTDRPEQPLVSGAILAEWAESADSTRFSTTPRLRKGYATAEVDAFRKELRDTFLGVRPPPLTWDEAHDKQFTPTRLRPGYKVEQVDAFVDKAEQRLAAMRSDVVRRALKRYVARS
jgi:DivIVA domain-containing protein